MRYRQISAVFLSLLKRNPLSNSHNSRIIIHVVLILYKKNSPEKNTVRQNILCIQFNISHTNSYLDNLVDDGLKICFRILNCYNFYMSTRFYLVYKFHFKNTIISNRFDWFTAKTSYLSIILGTFLANRLILCIL